MKRCRKQHLKIAGILTIIFALSAGSLWYFFIKRSNNKKMENQVFQREGAGTVTAVGVTEIGMDAVAFGIDFLEDTSLYVEDVYLANGDTVAAGEACIKFTDDSIERARTELEKAIENADLAYRSKVIANGEDKIQAKYTYDMTVLEAEYAPQIYQDTLTQLEMQLVKAQKAYEEAQEEYDAYYLAVTNNTFYEDYQIEKLKKAYEDAYDLCTNRGEYWDVTEEELSMRSASSGRTRAGQSDRQWIIETVTLLREETLEARAEYEQAQQDYRREIEGAELKLQKLFNQLEQAEQNYQSAQIEYQKGSFRAKKTCELTTAKSQMAENDYNICRMRLTDELESQEDAKSRAVENKELFEKLLGDGYFYTENAGTVAKIWTKEGQALAGGDWIYAYEDTEEIFVSAAVPEQDMEELFVGENARVTIADGGHFDGVIESIQPVINSKEEPEYCIVRVSLEGDLSMLEPDQTAVVVFGAEEKAVELDLVSQMYTSNFFSEMDEEHAKYLQVADVYIEAGQYVKEGDQVCRFTQDSIENVRKELTYTQSKAQRALMRAQAEYHIGVLEAGLSHNETLIDASLAQTEYDNTIARLNSDMAAKTLAIEQLLSDIYQLQLSLTEDRYIRQRADITNAYEQARRQVEKTREDFVNSRVEAFKTFQAAKEAYEDFLDQFEGSNQQIADKMKEIREIQDEVLRSQQFLERELMSAEQMRISAQTKGEIAYATYADQVKTYENMVNKAQADLDQAMRKLDEFNQFVGEGIVYATGDGLVMEVGVKKGDRFVDAGKLVSYVAAADLADSVEDSQAEGDALSVSSVAGCETLTAGAHESTGVIEQYFDMNIDILPEECRVQGLQVDKVLVSVGQQVQKGTPLFHVTSDSVKRFRAVLQEEILDTNREYELLKAKQKELCLRASQGYDNDIVNGRYAGTIYKEKFETLQKNTEAAKDVVDRKQDQVNDTLLELTQTQQELVEAQKYLRDAEIAVSENYSDRYDVAYYYTIYENTRETAQSMVGQLEKEIEGLSEKNESLLYEVDEAVRAYHQTVLDQEKGQLTAKKEYDTEIYRSERASEQYDIQMGRLDNALQEAKGHYESALRRIREFDACIARDRILSEYDGVVADIALEVGDIVKNKDKIVTFYDMEAIEIQ